MNKLDSNKNRVGRPVPAQRIPIHFGPEAFFSIRTRIGSAAATTNFRKLVIKARPTAEPATNPGQQTKSKIQI